MQVIDSHKERCYLGASYKYQEYVKTIPYYELDYIIGDYMILYKGNIYSTMQDIKCFPSVLSLFRNK